MWSILYWDLLQGSSQQFYLLSSLSSHKINRIMNSSNERRSNIPGEERDYNVSLEQVNTEKGKKDDTMDNDDENKSRSSTP